MNPIYKKFMGNLSVVLSESLEISFILTIYSSPIFFKSALSKFIISSKIVVFVKNSSNGLPYFASRNFLDVIRPKEKIEVSYFLNFPFNYDKQNNKHIWFEDGLINACYNCLDLNLDKGLGKKTAIHAIEKTGIINSISYEELLKGVINFILLLRS